jgi:hypothetical protein
MRRTPGEPTYENDGDLVQCNEHIKYTEFKEAGFPHEILGFWRESSHVPVIPTHPIS